MSHDKRTNGSFQELFDSAMRGTDMLDFLSALLSSTAYFFMWLGSFAATHFSFSSSFDCRNVDVITVLTLAF